MPRGEPSSTASPTRSSDRRAVVRVPDRAAWVNGRIVRGEQAMLSLHDRGARDGEGLFETIRITAGRPHQWAWHMERLVLSAAELGFPVPPAPARLAEALQALLEVERLSDAAARITVTRGVPGGRPTRAGVWIEAEPLAARLWRGAGLGGALLVVSRQPFEPGPLGRHKTTSRLAYALAREEARARGADEPLLATAAGALLEGATTNVFAVIGGRLRTPPLARGILPGVTRRWVLHACARLGLPVDEADLATSEALAADELFVTNAVQGVVPAAELEGRLVPGQAMGSRLRAMWKASLGA